MHAAKEVRVVSEQPDSGEHVEHPAVMWNRETDLRFECPAIGAEVDELVGIIFAGGRGDAEARAERGLGRALHEFFRCHRFATDEIDGEPQLDVSDSRASHRARFFEDIPGDVAPDVRHHEHGAGLMTHDAKRAPIAGHTDVEFRLDVLDGYRRVRQHFAGRASERQQRRNSDPPDSANRRAARAPAPRHRRRTEDMPAVPVDAPKASFAISSASVTP